MLVKLSNDLYINPDKISYIEKSVSKEGEWFIRMQTDSIILSQEHFDELLCLLPKPREGSRRV